MLSKCDRAPFAGGVGAGARLKEKATYSSLTGLNREDIDTWKFMSVSHDTIFHGCERVNTTRVKEKGAISPHAALLGHRKSFREYWIIR